MKLTRLDRLARIGYFARACVYALLGYLAVTTSALAHKGPTGEFQLLRSVPAGNLILALLALGLFAYGLYKIAGAALDTDGKGTGVKGIAERFGFAAGGAAYLAMSWSAFRYAAHMGSAGADNGGQSAAGTVLQLPLGSVVLALVGIGFLLAAGFQLRSAWTKRFMRMLERGAPPFTCTIGRIGLSARAVVFVVIGWSLMRSAWHESEKQVRDLGGALATLRDNEILYLAVAVGLIIFAVYSAIEARYRVVPPVDPVREARSRTD